MKQASIRRIKKEIIKRRNFNKIERFWIIKNISRGITNISENEIRLNTKIIKKNSVKRSSYRNHCIISGRAHSIYSHYKLSRNEMRRFAHNGLIYGLTKSSW